MAILAGVVVFAFLIGRVTAGGGSSANTSGLQAQINTLKSQNSALNTELQASNTGTNTGTQTGTNTVPTSTVTASPSPSTSSSALGPNGTTYQIKPGDSLSSIEAHFYRATGAQYTAAIEQANGMANSAIRAGQTLTIPPLSAITSGGGATTTTSPTPPVTVTTPAATHPTPTSTKR